MRTVLTYPRTPLGGVYIPSAKSIEGATGDIATTDGWIEDAKYKWYISHVTANASGEFDTAVTRTGTKTLHLTLDATGKIRVRPGIESPTGACTAASKPYWFSIKPSTSYTISFYVKSTNLVADTQINFYQFAPAFGSALTTSPTFTLAGTNDWTLKTATFTSEATAAWMGMYILITTAGNASDFWLDVNSITLIDQTALTRTVPTYPRTPLGGVYIPGAKSIEGATGDTPITAAPWWIESAKYGWCLSPAVGSYSAEFDTAVTRTGTKTVKISSTAPNSQGSVMSALAGTGVTLFTLKPSTAYVFRGYAKTSDIIADGCYITVREFDAAGATLASTNTNTLLGTNDWTLLTCTFTTNAATARGGLLMRNVAWGAGAYDCWFDVNSMTLTEVLPRTPIS